MNKFFSSLYKMVSSFRRNGGGDLSGDDIRALKELAYKIGTSMTDRGQELPIAGGRSSMSDAARTSLSSLLSTIVPEVPFDYLRIMEHLSKWDGDFSYAVDNIVQLSNTNFTVTFDDSVPSEQAKEMMTVLKRAWRNWYNQSDGINSLIGDLLAQTATTGSLSAEIVPRTDLKCVDKVVLVNPVNIRFKYDSEKDMNVPYQQVNTMGATVEGLIPLNTVTYKYYAIRRINDKPYAIPPLLSSLEAVAVEKDMTDSIRNVVSKLGMLGFLQVLVTAPQRRQGESDQMYQDRCTSYIDAAIPQVDKSLRKGYVLGFKDTHEFKMNDVTTNVNGAEKLFEMNAQLKMAGLKQDPLMLGRNFSTTETIGRVILAKLTTQITAYQKIVATFLEELFTMHLLLCGYKFDFMDVEFERPMVGDKLRDEQVFSAKIQNYNDLYNQGIVSQEQRAQALGFEKPDLDEPRSYSTVSEPVLDDIDDVDSGDDPTGDDDPTDPKTTGDDKAYRKAVKSLKKKMLRDAVAELKKSLGGEGEEFNYGE